MNEEGTITNSDINEQHIRDVKRANKEALKRYIEHLARLLNPDVHIEWREETHE